MNKIMLYRGISEEEYKSISKNGIPVGTVFTTDVLMASKYGKIIAIPLSDNLVPTKDNNTFKLLKIKEEYYTTIKPLKQFKEIGILN